MLEQSRSPCSLVRSSSVMVGGLVSLISFYQRFLSPHKGFCCAHRVLHGGPSCSVVVESILLERGAWSSWKDIWLRFRECQTAARTLRMECKGQLSAALAISQNSGESEAAAETSQAGATAASSNDDISRLCVECACCYGSCIPEFWI
ncbi:MAG: membrane protein insertion efficiency factor YidD [Planctomycetota bacterium]